MQCRSSGSASGPGGAPEPFDAEQARRRLERSFHKSADLGGSAPQRSRQRRREPQEGVIRDLPLWRVQWAALPGQLEVLYAHAPHYCHMFEALLAGPRPWRFGHLYLPGGSANLGSPDYALRPATKAPLVGVVMEVVDVQRLPEGRLLLLAAGLARFRVVGCDRELPYSTADVEVLADEEEVEEWRGLALEAVDDVAEAAPLLAVMRASHRAAAAAAAAADRVWRDYDFLSLRPDDSPDAAPESEARGTGGASGSSQAGSDLLHRPTRALPDDSLPVPDSAATPSSSPDSSSSALRGSAANGSVSSTPDEAGSDTVAAAASGQPPSGAPGAASSSSSSTPAPGASGSAFRAPPARLGGEPPRLAGVPALMWQSVVAPLQGLDAQAAGPPSAGDEVVPLPHTTDEAGDGDQWAHALRVVAAAATEAARAAARATALASLNAQPLDPGQLAAEDAVVLNTTTQRGVPSQVPDLEAIEREFGTLPPSPTDGISTAGAPAGAAPGGSAPGALGQAGGCPTLQQVLRLEAAVWQNLDYVLHLTQRTRYVPRPLSRGLLSLRPPFEAVSQEGEEASSPAGDGAGQDGSSAAANGSGGAELDSPFGAVDMEDSAARESDTTSGPRRARDPVARVLEGEEGDAGDAARRRSGGGASSSQLSAAPGSSSQPQAAGRRPLSGRTPLLGGEAQQPRRSASAGAGGQQAAAELYPALRRAQRLSYAMPMLLPEISVSEGRQALLEARGTARRLALVLAALRKRRTLLAAMAAVKDLDDL